MGVASRTPRISGQKLLLQDLCSPLQDLYSALQDLYFRGSPPANLRLGDVHLPMLSHLDDVTRIAGFSSTECSVYPAMSTATSAAFTTRSSCSRIERGRTVTAQYIDMVEHRRAGIAAMAELFTEFDLLVLLAPPIVAPRFSEATTVEACLELNAALLRNEIIAKFLRPLCHHAPHPGSSQPAF